MTAQSEAIKQVAGIINLKKKGSILKVLAVTGGRPGGNTRRAAEILGKEFIRIAKEDGAEAEFECISLQGLDMALCCGCRMCLDKGEGFCPCRDGIASLSSKMLEADAFIFGSPIYVEDVSGAVKNLIDRLAFNCYRPGFAGKLALVFTTSGGGTAGRGCKTLAWALRLWGYGVLDARNLRMGALMDREEIERRHGRALSTAAQKLYKGLKKGKAMRPSVYSLIVFAVQQKVWRKGKEDLPTKRHWEEKGWLNAGCSYYTEHTRGKIAITFARAASALIAVFFI